MLVAYEVYTTEAIVCGARPYREHDMIVQLYTKDAGMVFARATGARAARSKLRYALQEFSHARISLVKGKNDWRVTGAVSIHNFYYTAPSRASRSALLSSLRIIRRLVQGSLISSEVFVLVIDALHTFSQKEVSPFAEHVFLVRFLHALGYVAPEAALQKLLVAPTLQEACNESDISLSPILIRISNDALAASHL